MRSIKSWTSDQFIGTISLLIVCLMIFGFQLLLIVPTFLHLPLLPFAIGFRALYLALSLFIITVCIVKKKLISINALGLTLLVFWLFYSVRVLIDIGYKDLNELSQPSQSKFYFFSYIFGSGLIPCFAILMSAKFINFKKYSWLIILFAFLQTIVFSLVLMNNFDSITAEMLKYRTEIVSKEDVSGTILNPITMGRFGSVGIITFLAMIFLIRKKVWLTYSLGLFLGVTGSFFITLGGSRGPIITLILAILLILLFYFKSKRKDIVFYIRWVCGISAFYFFMVYQVSPKIDYREYAVLYRIVDTAKEKKKEERNISWTVAWNQFLGSPIFGDQMFDRHSWQYPHNVVIESFMSTGIIGGICFSFTFIYSFFKIISFKNSYPELQFVGLICFLILFANLFSGGLYFNSELWGVLPLVLAIRN